MIDPNSCKAPGFFKRMTAIFYDVLLVFSLNMLVTAVFLWIKVSLFGTEAEPGVAKRVLEDSDKPFLFILLFLTTFAFYAYFWTRHQCSLGMQAWRMRLVNEQGGNITLKQAFIRFLGVFVSLLPAGLGYLWILVDPNNKAWHDYLSKTRIIILPKDTSNTLLKKQNN